MTRLRAPLLFLVVVLAMAAVGHFQSWSVSLAILNLCLISAVMVLGVNIQWGYAGLFNVGIMGFAALGGVAAMLVSMPPVPAAWAAGGTLMALACLALIITIVVTIWILRAFPKRYRGIAAAAALLFGYIVLRLAYDPAVKLIEAVEPAKTGYLGGLGLPIILSWAVGGVFAAGAAWVVGKTTLGLRSDYLAIATLGISEIILAIVKNEDWLTRGVKNVTGLPRPVPLEIDLQRADWFLAASARFGLDPVALSSISVKLCFALLFGAVLLIIYWFCQRALNSPWGRMMRAIRDNRDAAAAMGKNVTARHLQVFVLGSAVVGIGGAMLTTLDGQLTPGTYNPLRYTFLIWVMVIVGGSGNNTGSIIGAFLVWFVWVQAEPAGLWFMDRITAGFEEASPVRLHLLDAAPHLRLLLMGLVLLLVLRFSPRGLVPEHVGR